jgi:hypothetical protein
MRTVAQPLGTRKSTAVPADLRAELLEAIRNLERQLRRLRRRLEAPPIPRDLTREIEQLLEHRAALTTPEVAKAIRARESKARAALKGHPERFSVRTDVPGRSPLARCWIRAPGTSETQPASSAESLEVSGG